MSKDRGFDYAGFKHLWLFGLARFGTHASLRLGFNRYRGRSQKWLFHGLDPYNVKSREIRSGNLDADILIGHVYDPHVAECVQELGLPVLDMRGDYSTEAWKTHQFDWRAVGRMAADYFLNQGFRHFHFLCFDQETRCNRLIWEGYRSRLKDSATTLCRVDRKASMLTFEKPERKCQPYEKTGIWLRSLPYPSALLLSEDVMGESLTSVAFYNKVAIPEQLAVLGVGNDTMVCESCLPRLSSIQLPAEKLGYEVARHADAVLKGVAPPDLLQLPPLRVVERQSTSLFAVEDPMVAKALSIMREEATSRMKLSEMIAQLPVSPRNFHDRFKKTVGRLPKDELFRIRFEIARDRLLETDETILHIALESGFSNVDSFVSYFKQETGMTPSAFRKENRI